MERPQSEDKQHQPQVSRTRSVHSKALQTKDSESIKSMHQQHSYSEEDINNFCNDVDESLGEQNHYTIVMGNSNALIRKRINRMETATGTFVLELRNERDDILLERTTSRKYKIINTMFQKKPRRRWTWKSPNGVTKARN